jgi:hypothetical protein
MDSSRKARRVYHSVLDLLMPVLTAEDAEDAEEEQGRGKLS